MRQVLEHHEQILSDLKGSKEVKKISEEEILKAVDECDTSHDGNISKEELEIYVL